MPKIKLNKQINKVNMLELESTSKNRHFEQTDCLFKQSSVPGDEVL